MIRYQVFNPMSGLYTTTDTLNEALQLRHQIISQYFLAQHLYTTIPTNNYFKASKEYADEFIAIRTGIAETEYSYSVYNATSKEVISHVFRAEEYLIKVAGEAVSEWYKQDGEINGIRYSYISLDLDTGTPIEYYNVDGPVMSKYDLSGNQVVSTHFFAPVPEDKAVLLDDFSHRESIFAWSDKDYGFIVEFHGPVTKPYDDCTDDEKAQLDAEKASFVANNSNLFVINKETVDADGNATWTIEI